MHCALASIIIRSGRSHFFILEKHNIYYFLCIFAQSKIQIKTNAAKNT